MFVMGFSNLNSTLFSNCFVFSLQCKILAQVGTTRHAALSLWRKPVVIISNHHRLQRHRSEIKRVLCDHAKNSRDKVKGKKQTANRHYISTVLLFWLFFLFKKKKDPWSSDWMMSSTTRSRSKFLLRVKYKSQRAISPALRLLRSLHAITQINQLHSVLANGTVAVSNREKL